MASPQPQARRAQILAEIATLGLCLPGSLVGRKSRCGNPGCVCHTDPSRMHGPYQSWTRKVAGKTLTRNLNAEQIARCQPWFDNARRLRELVAELQTLSVDHAERTEGWHTE